MDLDNQHQEGNPPGGLPQRKPLSRHQRYRLNKKLRKQQAQSNEAQNNQPQVNPPQKNQPLGKKNRKSKRQRQREKLQRKQAENSKAKNDQPQPSHPQQSLPQDGQRQNSQPQHNQHQNGQRQGKAPQGNKQRSDQPPTKILEEPPAWFGRVSQWYAEKPSVWKRTLDSVFQEEKDLSDWECNCSKKPKNCKCKQTQVLLHGEKAALNKDILKYQERRNTLKRALRVEAYEEAEEMKEMVQEEKAIVAGIQSAIRDINKSKARNARTPIGIRGCVYDLHCVELYQLLEDADWQGNEIAFWEDWETEEGTDEFDPPFPPEYTQTYGPSGYTPGTKLYAFVTLNEVVYGELPWCSNPFSGPEYAGKYILRKHGDGKQGENMEITFHNNDYLELKVYAQTVIGLCGGYNKMTEKFSNYFKNTKDQKKNQCFHFYGKLRRSEGSEEGSEEGSDERSEEGSEEGSDEGSEEGSEEGSDEGSEEDYEEDSEDEYEEESEEESEDNQQRKSRPRTKFLRQYPPWYFRVFRWEHERLGTFQEHDPIPEWFFDEDLSDWECDCTKDPPDCRCRQPQLKVRGGDFEDDEQLPELEETRNKRKRELRIQRFEEEKEEAEARERTPKVLEREIAKVSQIQAAIREIENSKAPDTKTPINIYHRGYDLYCAELCQLTQRSEILFTDQIWFNDDWEIRDEENKVEDPRMGVLLDDKPTKHMETDLCAFMTFEELDEIEYCSSNPFPNPRYAGRYSVGRWGLKDAPMEITFHSQDYLEIQIHSKAFLKNRGYLDPDNKQRLVDYFQNKKPYLTFYGALRTPERVMELDKERDLEIAKYEAKRPRSPDSPRDTYFERNHPMGAYYDSRYSEW
ncbi:hypothetical protein CcaCcLH18_09479 [Colletotrichum camelliae]|nr:hypothetical protein CcaCcLH18_09479 [Colletotrichum camelliae]